MSIWRELAFKEIHNKTIYYYGKAVYLGKHIPDFPLFSKYNLQFDCYLLDNGKFFWSFMDNIAVIDELDNSLTAVRLEMEYNILPLVTHVTYDDHQKMKKLKVKFNLEYLNKLIKNKNVKNLCLI